MGQQVGERLRHFPAPLQGLVRFLNPNPGLIALGYFASPLRGCQGAGAAKRRQDYSLGWSRNGGTLGDGPGSDEP